LVRRIKARELPDRLRRDLNEGFEGINPDEGIERVERRQIRMSRCHLSGTSGIKDKPQVGTGSLNLLGWF
jgi:hypothetical protein